MKKVILKIYRYNPEREREPRIATYTISYREGMTVLEALIEVRDNIDHSLAFRYCCRGAVCGACGLFINGKFRLACGTQVKDLMPEIVIGPLPHLKVLKDLVVDMDSFFKKYELVKPYLIPKFNRQKKELLQSPDKRKKLDPWIDCILCGCCTSSCTIAWFNKNYLGPAAIQKAYRFIVDSRDNARKERLKLVANEFGLWRCHTLFNCIEACPKNLRPTDAIQELKRMACYES